MKTKQNRKSSRKKIQEAVIDLLKDHELKDLKVTSICQKAQINRSSFYDNYTDIYDLIDKLKAYLVAEYTRTQVNPQQPSFLTLLQHIQNNQELYRLFFKLNLQKGLVQTFTQTQTPANDYDRVFFRSGIEAVISAWLANNCQESPEFIERIIEAHYHA